MIKVLSDIATSVEEGNSASVKELTRKALALSIPAEKILSNGLVQGMKTVGRKFKANEIFIPEVLIATRAMNAGLDVLKPSLAGAKMGFKGKILLATVKGDLHDIGKKIVGLMFEGAGYEVVDIGVDITKEKLLGVFKRERPAVIGLSALLTTTMTYMREVVEAFEAARLRKKVRIIIGGAPVTQSYADEIRADGYAADAASAVALVRSLVR